MGSSNEQRKAAEAQINELRKSNAEAFLKELVQFVGQSSDGDKEVQQKGSFAALLLKKQFLDDKSEEEGLW